MQPDISEYLAPTVLASVLQIARCFDVEFVTLHLFRGGADAQDKPYVRTNYPEAWISHYLLNDYVRIDPVLQMAEQTPEPFCWSALTVATPAQHDMMAQAARYGVRATGFSVAHTDAIGRRTVLSFNAQNAKGAATWAPYVAQNRDLLLRLAGEMHSMAIADVTSGTEDLPQLSPRELECLKWTAAGKPHTEIAIILNLSEHTVRSYLKSVRVKLDSVTLAQAVSKASSAGLI